MFGEVVMAKNSKMLGLGLMRDEFPKHFRTRVSLKHFSK